MGCPCQNSTLANEGKDFASEIPDYNPNPNADESKKDNYIIAGIPNGALYALAGVGIALLYNKYMSKGKK